MKMALPKMKSLRYVIFAIAVVFLLAVLCALQMQAVGWDEDVIYTGDGPFWRIEDVEYGGKQVADDGTDEHDVNHVNASTLTIPHPIILWWTPFTGERGRVKKCGNDQCFFTIDRHFQHHQNTTAFLFYGTDFRPADLPLPRRPNHEWGLFHEESPKNNYMLSYPDCLTLFNHTATFKRNSDYPITTQYLNSIAELESRKYFKTLKEKKKAGLAPVVYVQTDCDPPSDRDNYVRELMKYIPIDAYGACLHNKDLPNELVDPLTMEKSNFYEIMSKYKFTLSFENALCDDYVTEKLWRPLMLGSVPVYRGSPSVHDWLPDKNSAVVANDYKSPKELAEFLKYLDSNDEAYEKYVRFKQVGVKNKYLLDTMKHREWGVNDFSKVNFIDGFECLVCRRIHENIRARKEGRPPTSHIAGADHYSCPRPEPFSDKTRSTIELYLSMHNEHKYRAKALRQFVESNSTFTAKQYSEYVFQLMKNEH